LAHAYGEGREEIRVAFIHGGYSKMRPVERRGRCLFIGDCLLLVAIFTSASTAGRHRQHWKPPNRGPNGLGRM